VSNQKKLHERIRKQAEDAPKAMADLRQKSEQAFIKRIEQREEEIAQAEEQRKADARKKKELFPSFDDE
jgi:hypothetical protein